MQAAASGRQERVSGAPRATALTIRPGLAARMHALGLQGEVTDQPMGEQPVVERVSGGPVVADTFALRI